MARSPKQLRKRYLSRPPVEPMRLRPGMTVEELVGVYRRAGAFNGGAGGNQDTPEPGTLLFVTCGLVCAGLLGRYARSVKREST